MTTPKISVCMPMFNASRYLRECIDSILAQTFTDFELLIADDGSTDNSVEIVESYTDPRIRLICRPHDYIATLNCLLSEARGEYIARMDADDVMLPNRLQLQVDYMDANPEVDVLGGGIIVFGDGLESQLNCIETVSMIEMIDSCALAHPTVLMRKATLQGLGLNYSPNHAYAEDYELWVRMLEAGCTIRNLNQPLIQYRRSKQQISTIHAQKQQELTTNIKRHAIRWMIHKTYEVLDTATDIRHSDCQLTVVIPFLNEGDDVVETVRSVRETAGMDVEIVIINDHSTDNYDYEKRLRPFCVRYYENSMRLGAALSKERGVQLSPTPYFIILDAHMRCLTPNWHKILVSKVKENPNTLFCCKTIPFIMDGNRPNSQPIRDNKAAYLTFIEDTYIPGIRWLEEVERSVPGLKPDEICAILGASYASSRQYWDLIHGMRGLLSFGCEEAYLSLKSWLAGNGCHYISGIIFSHKYRNNASYYLSNNTYVYNYLAICRVLLPQAFECRALIHARDNDIDSYVTATVYLEEMNPMLLEIRQWIKQTQLKDVQHIIDLNHCASAVQNKIDSVENLEFLKSVAERLTPSMSVGLLDGGATGQLLFLLLLVNIFPDLENRYEPYCQKLYGQMNQTVDCHLKEYSIKSGITGIGIGLVQMKQFGLIEDSVEETLKQIDRQLNELSPCRIRDDSFASGIGGILCYAVTRLSVSSQSHCFEPEFISELQKAAQRLVSIKCDLRTTLFAAQFLKISGTGEGAFKQLTPMDINKPNRFIPQEPSLWLMDGANILGYATEIAYLKYLCNKYEKKQI